MGSSSKAVMAGLATCLMLLMFQACESEGSGGAMARRGETFWAPVTNMNPGGTVPQGPSGAPASGGQTPVAHADPAGMPTAMSPSNQPPVAGSQAPSGPGTPDPASNPDPMSDTPRDGSGDLPDPSTPQGADHDNMEGMPGMEDDGTDAMDPPADPGFPDGDYYNPVTPCEQGALQGGEVVILGDSFYALSGEIKRNLDALAQAAGTPSPYRSNAVSGATLARNGIPGQFDRALQGGPVKLVIMDGGGNDSIAGSCPACAGIVKDLFAHMAESGVEDVLYTYYPDPGNPPGTGAFKPNLDELRLAIREVCVMETALRCHFQDLRPYWENGDTVDGLHPTASGARHVADAIWGFMRKDCLAQ